MIGVDEHVPWILILRGSALYSAWSRRALVTATDRCCVDCSNFGGVDSLAAQYKSH